MKSARLKIIPFIFFLRNAIMERVNISAGLYVARAAIDTTNLLFTINATYDGHFITARATKQ